MMRTHRVRSTHSRRGILSMELVLALPILMFLLFGLFEFSLLFSARGDVTEASRAGARLATLTGVNEIDIENEVQRSLGGRFGNKFEVAAELGQFSGDEVAVAVRVPMSSASPDLLWPVGYSIRGQYIIAETRMRKE